MYDFFLKNETNERKFVKRVEKKIFFHKTSAENFGEEK